MTSIFGLCSLGIGILLVIKCVNLPVMVLATLIGALIGEFCHLEKSMPRLPKRNSFSPNRMPMQHTNPLSKAMWRSSCCFAPAETGIFRAIHEGMTGDPNILIAKSFSRFLHRYYLRLLARIAVSAIFIPMLAIQLTLATCAALILPLTTPAMMADFSAVGGLLLLATGFADLRH